MASLAPPNSHNDATPAFALSHLHGKDPASQPGVGGSYPLLCHLLDTAVVIEHLWWRRVRPKLRIRIAGVLGMSEEQACRILMLIAAVHDVGKLTSFFQYQERAGAPSGFAAALRQNVGLPGTDPRLIERLNANKAHPLRRHEFISHRAVTGEWADSKETIRGDRWVGILAGGHHGYWRAPIANGCWVGGEGGDGNSLINGWTDTHDTVLRLVEGAIGLRIADVPKLSGPAASVPFVCFSGMLTLADWIASDDRKVGAGKALWQGYSGTSADPYTSPDAARAWMETRGPELRAQTDDSLGKVPYVGRDEFTTAVMGDHAPRPLQAEAIARAEANDAGLWICTYPTGDGKTESALLRGAVDTEEGFFFGLPTLATTDAMEDRLLRLAGRLSDPSAMPLTKSHQFAYLREAGHEPSTLDRSDDGCCDFVNPSWYTAAIRKLVAMNVVGTIDQALTGALAQRHITLRLFGLANHHVILDEIHTFDPYQTQLLIELLYWWGATGTRVTLLSATLPTTHLRAMVQAYIAGVRGSEYAAAAPDVADLDAPFPSTVSVSSETVEITVRLPEGEVRRPQDTEIEVKEVGSRAERITAHVTWAQSVTSSHPTSPVAIVSNVVGDCAQIAAALSADPDVTRTHEVICLHSSLVAAHRKAVEGRLISRAGDDAHRAGFGAPDRRPVLVVGTQVIQASLDFDVDFLSTDLAPAPDLLQRLGRSWRFEGALPGAFRGGRLPLGAQRCLHVISVVGDDRVPTRAGTVPYLAAGLMRTHACLVERIEQSPLVDVFGFSQEWVDTAYDRDPSALLSEDEQEQREAMAEELDGLKKRQAASLSKAALGSRNGAGGEPLLPAPKGWSGKGPRWQDLVTLTETPDDEDLMRTRYIELESVAVLLFDSRGESYYVDPTTGQRRVFPDLDVDELARQQTWQVHSLYARWRNHLPSWLALDSVTALERTLSGKLWTPKAKVLASTPPLDLAQLAGIAWYHPTTGLMKGSR